MALPRHIGYARVKPLHLTLALLVLLAGLLSQLLPRPALRSPHDQAMRSAAQRAQAAQALILERMVAEGIPIEPEDLNRTGLIGPELTPLTSSLGILEAKRCSLNPDFAALIYRYYREAGLKPGDRIALGISGSFPGLAIAALSAAQELQLEARVIASFSASNHGATRPEMSLPRMLRLLKEGGLLDFELIALSLGGEGDRGPLSLFEDAEALIRGLAAQEDAPLIEAGSLEQSMQERLRLYGEGIRCFVNIGGASANIGQGMQSIAFPNGLTLKAKLPAQRFEAGLLSAYAAQGIPVIHLLNIRDLASQEGLPIDPVPLPEPGLSAVYFEAPARQAWVIVLSMAASLALLAAGRLSFDRKERQQ